MKYPATFRFALLLMTCVCLYGSTNMVPALEANPASKNQPFDDAKMEKLPWQQVLNDEQKQHVESLEQKITELKEQERYREAIPLAKEILEIRKSVQGADHWQVVDAAWQLRSLQLHDALSASGKAALSEADRLDQDLVAHYSAGDYDAAIAVARRQVALREKQLEADHPDVAASLNNVALLLWAKGDPEEAIAVCREANAIWQRIYHTDHPNLAVALNNLAQYLDQKGDYQAAEPLHRQAISIWRRVYGDEHADVAQGLSNLGLHLFDRGEYAAAEPVMRQALSMFRRLVGNEHNFTATALNNLGSLLRTRGDYPNAMVISREALALRRSALGEEHPLVALDIHNYAALLKESGDSQQAEPFFREALSLWRSLHGEDHPDVALGLCSLAATLADLGQLEEAELLHRQSLALRQRLFGDLHPDLSRSLDHLGCILSDAGKQAEAEPLLRQALEIDRQLLGEDHPATITTLGNLALLEYRRGHYLTTINWLRQAAERFEKARLRASYHGLDRVQFTMDRSPAGRLAGCLARTGQTNEAWQWLEASFARGLLDAITSRQARSLLPEEWDQEVLLLRKLNEFDEKLETLADGDADRESRRSRINQLTSERELLQTELAVFEESLATKYGVPAGEAYTLSQIKQQLSEDEAILAWLDIGGDPHAINFTGEHWACVVRASGDPVWVSLPGMGKEGHWTPRDSTLATRFRRVLDRSTRGLSSVKREELRQELIAQRITPVLPHLAGISRLVVLPAGEMAGIPVEVLTDQFTIGYAPSGTMHAWLRENQLAKPESKGLTSPRLLALGDPLFTRAEAESTNPSHDPLDAVLSVARNDSFAALPGSRIEVQAVSRFFQSSEQAPTVLLGAAASEQRIDELARTEELRTFDFIHLATHGVMDDQVAMQSALILSQVDEDPLAQVLSERQVHDGRLTMAQVIRTWELDAELVVLSGCQTALGKRAGGEGFLGFSQALFVAGAQSLLLSLWDVDDNATTLLMIRFYQNLLGRFDTARTLPNARYEPGRPMPKAEALREAKSWLRELTTEQISNLNLGQGGTSEHGPAEAGESSVADQQHRPFADPHHWAAFILIGDSR